jgi:hypothetical protein
MDSRDQEAEIENLRSQLAKFKKAVMIQTWQNAGRKN